MTFGGASGSINFPATGSGGPIMDFEATSEVGGGFADGTVGVDGGAKDAGVGPGSALEATIGGFSTVAAVFGAAGDPAGAEAGFCALAGVSVGWTGAGAEAAEVVAVDVAGAATGVGRAAAAFAERVLDETAF